MNKIQKGLRETILKQTKARMKMLVSDREISKNIPIPDLPEPSYFDSSGFALTYGFEPGMIRTIYKMMSAAGWHCSGSKTETAKDLIAYVRGENKSNENTHWYNDDFGSKGISIWFVVGSDGSNCQRVKIGTETVEQDIYEIVCNDGAAEGAI